MTNNPTLNPTLEPNALACPITYDDLLAALRERRYGSYHDQEIGHKEADILLLRYINDPAITEAFLKVGRWYS